MRSAVCAEFTRMLGTNNIRTMACYSISNDIIECFHRPLKSSLKAHENNRLSKILPVEEVKEDFPISCAELVYGTTLRLPNDL